MIIEIDKNLLEADVEAFAHSCNCFKTMGSGIAAQIKAKYPEMYKADFAHGRRGDRTVLGTFSWVKCHDGKIGYNVYGQYTFGMNKRHTSYDAVDTGLTAIRNHAILNNINKLGLPKNMGCALGGGNWGVVRAIIEAVFQDFPSMEVYICNYQPT